MNKEQIPCNRPKWHCIWYYFWLTAVPQYGQLYIENKGLNIGDTFTQEDINSGKLEIYHIWLNISTPDGFHLSSQTKQRLVGWCL